MNERCLGRELCVYVNERGGVAKMLVFITTSATYQHAAVVISRPGWPSSARSLIVAAAPPGPPTANSDELFAGMKSPVPLESPEGQAALARLQSEGAAPPGPPTANADDVFAGMKSPIPLDSPEGQEALARMGVDAASVPPASAPASPGPPPPAALIPDEKLYPMPVVPGETSQIFLPFLPFGIARSAFAISAGATAVILGLLLYLLSLTS